MKTNHYESVVIVNATLEDDQIEGTFGRIEELIKSNGGEITENDKWGRKRLAYPIQKSKSGYYSVYRFIAPRELIAKLERAYRLDESIIRYLTIVLDKKAIEHKLIAEEVIVPNSEEVVKEEVVKEEVVKEKVVKEEVVKEEVAKEEAVKEEAMKDETVKEDANNNESKE